MRFLITLLLVILLLPLGAVGKAIAGPAPRPHDALQTTAAQVRTPIPDCPRGLYTGAVCLHDLALTPQIAVLDATAAQRMTGIDFETAGAGITHTPPRAPPRPV